MKVLHLNYSDQEGGAARAAYRIHLALRAQGIDSNMVVRHAKTGDWTVQGPKSHLDNGLVYLRASMGFLVNIITAQEHANQYSTAIFPSRLVKWINESDADIIHLHWLQNEMLSIADIAKINKPVVWTLHDMWAFCGAEHYSNNLRWREGYTKENRPRGEKGLDINRWSWARKRKHWRQPIPIVTPSHWLADCVGQSALMRGWPVRVIANGLNLQQWQPIAPKTARQLLGLPMAAPLILFGAMNGGQDARKGFDLLTEALAQLILLPESTGMELVVFGQRAPKNPPHLGFPIHYMGHLNDELSLRALYSAVNVLVIPSRQDNLPNTGLEALSCGTPVVAFNTGGLADIVSHQQNGYLAQAFNTEDLAKGIAWVFTHHDANQLRQQSRQSAERCFDHADIARKYIEVYKQVCAYKKS